MAKPDGNKIRNPNFTAGAADPTSWERTAKGGRIKWRRAVDATGKAAALGVEIASSKAGGEAWFAQTIACKPGEFYHFEVVVTCDLRAADDSAGLMLRVQPMFGERPRGPERVTPGIHRSASPTTVRAFYQAPPDVRRLRLSIGVRNAAGMAQIRSVHAFEIIAPEEGSHPLAIPPPAYALPPIKSAKSVCVWSKTAEERPITRLFRQYLGDSKVGTLSPADALSESSKFDALLLPDAQPPRAVRSLSALKRLAEDRIVVISLPAFAKLAAGKLPLRCIRQNDDPIGAHVEFADAHTRGFALHDTFSYSWSEPARANFVQNQFRRTPAFKLFCKRHGLTTRLVSLCNQESTSEQPVCLSWSGERGALFVLDIDPVEAAGSTMAEPTIAMYFLLGLLGRTQNGLGQFCVPVHEQTQFREMVREAGARFREFVVHDEETPSAQVRHQLVTIGGADESYGLPLKPKPVILVRSGLVGGDMESVYGCLTWFKQLIRMPPYACPYAEALASRFRFAWIPCAAPWAPRDGWKRSGAPPVDPMELEFEDDTLAAVIDVVSLPINRVRVVVPNRLGEHGRVAAWLPRLFEAFQAGQGFSFDVPEGDPFTDYDRMAWRMASRSAEVTVDPDGFQEDVHRAVLGRGGCIYRLEVPGCDANFVSHSIQRTDIVATLLEQTVGLQYGLIAVNRTMHPVHFDGFQPLAPGEAHIVDRRDPILQATPAIAG